MVFVPIDQNFKNISGTEMRNEIDFEDDAQKEEKKTLRTLQEIEKFEINYGQPENSIIASGNDRRRQNSRQRYIQDPRFNDSENNQTIDNGLDGRKNEYEINKLEEDNTNTSNDNVTEELEKEDDNSWQNMYNTEPFYGSQIIENEERILTVKSILVAILFLIVSHSAVHKVCRHISKSISFVSPIIIQSVLYGVLFIILEKYLLR